MSKREPGKNVLKKAVAAKAPPATSLESRVVHTTPAAGSYYEIPEEGVKFQGMYRVGLETIHVTDAFGREYDISPAQVPDNIGEYKDLFHAGVRIAISNNQLADVDRARRLPIVVPGEHAYDKYGSVFSVKYTLCADDSWRCVPVLVSVTPSFITTYGVEMLSDLHAGLVAVHEQNAQLAKAHRDLATKMAGVDRKARQEIFHAESVGRDHETLSTFHQFRANLHERRGDLFEAILKQYADEGSWTVTEDGKSILNTSEPGFELAKAALANPISVAARA